MTDILWNMCVSKKYHKNFDDKVITFLFFIKKYHLFPKMANSFLQCIYFFYTEYSGVLSIKLMSYLHIKVGGCTG